MEEKPLLSKYQHQKKEISPKEQDWAVRVTVREASRKVNYLSKVIWDRKRSSPGLSVPPEQVSQSLWWMLKSPKTNTLADGLIKGTWRWSIEEKEIWQWSKAIQKDSLSTKFERRLQIFIELGFREFYDSKSSGLHRFYNMAMIDSVKIRSKTER